MKYTAELQATIAHLSKKGTGLLAADESAATIAKRLEAVGVESTEESRRAYRDMLFTTPRLGDYISGVILFEETLTQKDSNQTPFVDVLKKQNILSGIKVDKGLVPLNSESAEKVTQGLDDLAERLKKYKSQGATFAKWRAVYTVGDATPTSVVNSFNAVCLARYAAICQDLGIVPIVEPEVLIDGDHTIEMCESVTEKVLRKVFAKLAKHRVALEYMVLKPSMVISGKSCAQQSTAKQVAEATLRVLKRTVPSAVPTINFLSGGQTPEQATEHLALMNQMGPLPWHLSFSYARALQEPSLNAYKGKMENKKAAQDILLERARLNHLATMG